MKKLYTLSSLAAVVALGGILMVARTGRAADSDSQSGIQSQAAAAAPDCFKPADFRGSYGVSVEGVLADKTRIFEIGRLHADGISRVTTEFVLSAPGGIRALEVFVCKYSIRKGGMGTMDCASGEGETAKIEFVLADGGKEIRFVSVGSADAIFAGVGRRQ
jgi:hypothetical protein